MLKLIIQDDEGRRTVVPFVRQEITVGRQEGNTIRLTERNVSRHHARLVRENGVILVEDLGSYNGVRLNGERIEGRASLRDGDRIQIGDYELAIEDDAIHRPDRSPTAELEKPPFATPLILPRAVTSPREVSEPKPQAAEARPAEPPRLGPPPPPMDSEPERPRAKPAVEPRSPLELDPKDAPRLVVLNTEYAGREFPCLRKDLKIGRSSENDIVLDHASLSRTHARMLRDSSGEWQIVDLDSSNGMLVNGETFGKARLRGGDLLQLGQVKLKFVVPGESFAFDQSPEQRAARSRRHRWIAAAILGVVIVGGLFWYLRNRAAPVEEKPVPVAEKRPAAPPKQPTVETVQPQTKVAQEAVPPTPAAKPTHSEEAPSAPPAPPVQLEAKLRAANAAMTRRDFQKAIEILESVKSSDDSRPPEVDDPLYRANLELGAKKKLSAAQKSLGAGKVDEALRLLDESTGTVAFSKEHDQLKARAEAARRATTRKKEKEVKVAQATKAFSPDAVSEDRAAARSTPVEDAQKFYDEGTLFYRKGQYADAASTLNECLRVDPSFAKCHMVLGSTYAKLREPELGAQHYRRFVQLAPNDPDAAKVKVYLEQYESAKAPSK